MKESKIKMFALIFLFYFPLFQEQEANSSFETIIELRIKITKPGNYPIINNNFIKPDSINVDGQEVEDIKTEINDINSNIKLAWKEKITNFHGLFSGLSHLIQINFINIDTSEVTDMSYMFESCTSLQSLDLSSFKTSNAKNMSGMFSNCSSLQSLNINEFNTEKVEDTSYMFNNCQNLISINLTNFKTSNVQNISGMFKNCKSLKSIDLSGFDTSSVTDMSFTFFGCKELNSLELSKMNTKNVKNMSGMLELCMSIEKLDFSNFDTSSVTDMSYMFHGCTNLISLNLSNFKTSNVKNMFGIFASDISLTSLNISNFDISNVEDISQMFYECDNLLNLDISNFNASTSLTERDKVFEYSDNLKFINLKSFHGLYIFDSIPNDTIICMDDYNSINSITIPNINRIILQQTKNANNNCSNLCFYEFNKINKNGTGCEVDCSKLKKGNEYYDKYCVVETEKETNKLSSDAPKTDKIIETNKLSSDAPKTDKIIETNKLSPIIQTDAPKTDKIIETDKLSSTIIQTDAPKTDKIIKTDKLSSTIIQTDAPKTDKIIETNTLLSTIIQTTIKEITSSIITTPETMINENNTKDEKIDDKNETNLITDIPTSQESNSQLKLLLFDFYKYSFVNNIISFSIIFVGLSGEIDYPRNLEFTINIDYSQRRIRQLDTSRQIASCTFEENNNILYSCQSQFNNSGQINNISVTNDFNFNKKVDVALSQQALKGMSNLLHKGGDLVGNIFILIGDLYQEDDYFTIKGHLKGNNSISINSNNINLTVFEKNNRTEFFIPCVIVDKNIASFEIKCSKDKPIVTNLNNTVASLDSNKKLLISLNDNNNDLYEEEGKDQINNNNNRFYSKKKSSSNKTTIIVVIIVALVVLIIIVIFAFIILKKVRQEKYNKSHEKSTEKSENKVILNV